MYSLFVQVILNNNSKSTDRIYTYGVPNTLISEVAIGKRVKVSFANNKKSLDALVVNISDKCDLPENKIKPILDIIDKKAIVTKELVKLAFWMRNRYICKFSDVIRLMVPSQIKFEHKINIMLSYEYSDDVVLSDKERELLNAFKGQDVIELKQLKKLYTNSDIYNVIDSLREKSLIVIDSKSDTKKVNTNKSVSLSNKELPLEAYKLKNAIKQLEIVKYLMENGDTDISILLKKTNSNRQSVKSLEDKGYVIVKEYLYDDTNSDSKNCTYSKVLNDEQEHAYEEIIDTDDKVFLLHGVTGSGKTEVYLAIIDYYAKLNKQSIMLVPEISLTSQTIDRFREKFGNRIAVFHSKLTQKQKYIEWSRVYNKEVDVIIGARSAVFAPIESLGVIIVDEEHEDVYKSSTAPKYDTVETAIKRSYIENAKVILGSATPSVRTYNMVLQGHIRLLQLKRRANNAIMPSVTIEDMRSELEAGNNTVISRQLYKSIKRSLQSSEQVILFINRRGYSSFISCKSCGNVIKCDKCDVSMTYHNNRNKLVCHYCGSVKPIFETCPNCGSDKIEQFGAGTQQAEELIGELFSGYKIARMDMDTMSSRDSYEKIYNDFKTGNIDILIGTQMLTKGLDFPNVTTVGVLSADSLLNLPFYNAGEKTFQLITQVSGRAGRGDKEGRVYIQTYDPDNFIINYSRANDFNSFIDEELKMRKEFAYPPFINIFNVCTMSKNEKQVIEVSQGFYNRLNEKLADVIKNRGVLIYKPTPHGIYKVNNEYRINLFIKASLKFADIVKQYIRETCMIEDIKGIKISINIDTENI